MLPSTRLKMKHQLPLVGYSHCTASLPLEHCSFQDQCLTSMDVNCQSWVVGLPCSWDYLRQVSVIKYGISSWRMDSLLVLVLHSPLDHLLASLVIGIVQRERLLWVLLIVEEVLEGSFSR